MRYSRPQSDIIFSSKALNLFLGGKGSGKSHIAGVISKDLIGNYPNVRGFIGANTYEQLNTSTMVRVFQVWASEGWKEYSEQNQSGCYVVGKQPPKHFKQSEDKFLTYSNIISFANGGSIYLGSLENAKAHEGKEFGWTLS